MCDKRGRPADCTWDLLSNDAALPLTIARSADVDVLASRLAHVEAYLRTLPPNLAPFTPFMPESDDPTSSSHLPGTHPRKQLADETFSDTEDAAVLLENGVFGTRPILGPDSPDNSSSLTMRRDDGESSSRAGPRGRNEPRFGRRSIELTKSLTSIVSQSDRRYTSSRAHLNVEFDATLAEVEVAALAASQRILRALPSKLVVHHLVNLYFTSVSWLFHHLHAPSFLVEVDAFYVLLDAGRADEVDIFWVALLLMVCLLSLSPP